MRTPTIFFLWDKTLLKPKPKGLRIKGANGESTSLRAREDRCFCSWSQETTNLTPSICWFIQDPYGPDNVHPHFELSITLSPPILVHISSRDTHIGRHRNNVEQITCGPSGSFKLTQRVKLHTEMCAVPMSQLHVLHMYPGFSALLLCHMRICTH